MKNQINRTKRFLLFLFFLLFTIPSGLAQPAFDQFPFFTLKSTGDIEQSLLPAYKGTYKHTDNQQLILVGGVALDDFATLLSPLPDSNWNQNIIVFSKTSNGDYQKKFEKNIAFGPRAFGAVAAFESGFFCLGGLNGIGVSKEVRHLKWNNDENNIEIQAYPDLPVPLALSSATVFQNKVYIVGGITEVSGNQGNLAVFRLDLNLAEPVWGKLPSGIPQTILFPTICAQGDGLNNCLYVFGGLDKKFNRKKNVFKLDLKTNLWTDLSSLFLNDPVFQDGFPDYGIPIGNSGILFMDSKDGSTGFEEVRTNEQSTPFFVFNTITKSYAPLGESKKELQAIFPGISLEDHLLLGISPAQVFNVFELEEIDREDAFGILDIIVLILYFLVMVYIGVYYSKKHKTEDDYFKAGQRIPWWAAGLSLLGTGLSAITFMAVPAKAFATDWAYFLTRLPLIFIPFLLGYLYIPFFRNLNLTSAYEYLQKRFNLPTRLVASFSFIVFQLGRIGIVLFLPAVALNIATDFDILTCIMLMGLVSVLYTMLGGIEAVIWTDVIQVILLMGGMMLCIVFISFKMENGFSQMIEIGARDDKFNILNIDFNFMEPSFWVVIIGGFFTHLITYSSDQTMVQRYMTTKSNKDATKSLWTSIGVSFGLGWIFFFMGTALYAYYQTHPTELLPTMESNDAIFPWYIISELPDGLSGLLIAGIFAAAMSSLSSSMNSAATAYTMDFHKLFKKEFDAVKVGRIVTLFIGLGGVAFAILFATLNVKSIWDEFIKIIGLITGGLGGVFLLGIITTRANGAGALIGLLVSAMIQYYVGLRQPFHFMLFTATGFISCFVSGYLFSLVFSRFNKPIDGLTIYTLKPEK